MANMQGTRWRGQLPIPPKAHPLVRQLFRAMNQQQTTLREVASRAGLQPATVSNWRYTNTPRVPDLEACFNVLDMKLVVRANAEDA